MPAFRVHSGNLGRIAKLQVSGSKLTRAGLEQLFVDRCLAEGYDVDGSILTSFQQSLDSDEEQAEAAAYVFSHKLKVKT